MFVVYLFLLADSILRKPNLENRRSLNEMADNVLDDLQMEPQHELHKFGMDNWNLILRYLGNGDLANVSTVCKDFQSIARSIFARRYKKLTYFRVEFGRKEWKLVLWRFRDLITDVVISERGGAVRQEDFNFFEICVSESLRSMHFHLSRTMYWRNIIIHRRFPKLEFMSFDRNYLRSEFSLLHDMHHWFPNLKALDFSRCLIDAYDQLLQCKEKMSFLQRATFHFADCIDMSFCFAFMIKNPQIKHLKLSLPSYPQEAYMASIPIVNKLLPSLQSLAFGCNNLTSLPTFPREFRFLKYLTFDLLCVGTYKNELLKIMRYFPVIDGLAVTDMKENLMTNDDLIDLLTQSSRTLTKLLFTSRGCQNEMKFGYYLLRKICSITSNRSDVAIGFQFCVPKNKKSFIITKEWIKENGEYMVINESRAIIHWTAQW